MFQWILDLFSSSVTEIPKTIIYCRSLKDSGEIYSLFDEVATNSQAKVVTMYHSKNTRAKLKQKSTVISLGREWGLSYCYCNKCSRDGCEYTQYSTDHSLWCSV